MKLVMLLAFMVPAFCGFGQATISSATLSSATIGGTSPGGGVTTEIADAFTGSDGTDLTNHVTTTGGYTWVTDSPTFTITGNAITNNTDFTHYSRYWISHTMSSADYTASISVGTLTGSSGTAAALGIRDNGAVVASRSAYFVIYRFDTGIGRLYKVVNGAAIVQLGTDLTGVGDATNLWISATGTTISAKVNTVAVPGTPVTDSAISSAGFVGLGAGYADNTAGYTHSHLFTMDDLLVTVP